MLQAAADDLRFDWLKGLSQAISELAEARAAGEARALEAAIERVGQLLAPPDPETAFRAPPASASGPP